MDNKVITPQSLKSRISGSIDVYCFDSIDSTNSEARRMLKSGASGRLLITAREQTAGRGRQGKSFYSPADTGIYMSLVLMPDSFPSELLSATTAAAAAVCASIEKLSGKHPMIKWVNDIYLDGKKICGILTEAVTKPDGRVGALIIGIGINISTVLFPDDLTNAGSLGEDIPYSELICEIVNTLCSEKYSRFSGFIDYYRKRSLLIGREITFIKNNISTPALAVGIDDTGGLIVRLSDGSEATLTGGEISIRQRD